MIKAVISAQAECTRTAKAEYLLAPDVILLLIQDGSARLLHLGGNFYAISQTGAAMLHETLRADTATAAQRIAAEDRAELPQVQRDMRAFLHDLEERHLIYCPERTRRVFPRRAILPSLILMPLLRCLSLRPALGERRVWMLLTLAYLSIRVFGWPKTMAVWQRYLHANIPKAAVMELEPAVARADGVVRAIAARHLLQIECKERALICWTLIRSAGLPAKLVLGVNLFPLESHCWCEAGPFVLSDNQDWCEQFEPVLSYE